MTKYLFLITLVSCSSFVSRKPSNIPVEATPTTSCGLILKKLTRSPLPMVKDEDFKIAIEEMKEAGITFTEEELFTIQWSSNLSSIVTDSYISHFMSMELQQQGKNLNDKGSITQFLENMDTNQMYGLIEAVANDFISFFAISSDITTPKNIEKVAKSLGMSIKIFLEEKKKFTQIVVENQKIVEINILLHLKNRYKILSKNLKEVRYNNYAYSKLPLLSFARKKLNIENMVFETTRENYLKVYSDTAYFFDDDQLIRFVKAEHSAILSDYYIRPSFYDFLSKYYKKITLQQFKQIENQIKNVDYKNRIYLKKHIEYLEKIHELNEKIAEAKKHLEEYPSFTEDDIIKLNKAIEDRQKIFDQMDYL